MSRIAITAIVVLALGDFLVGMNGRLCRALELVAPVTVVFYVLWVAVGLLWIAADRELGSVSWLGHRPRGRLDLVLVAVAVAGTIFLYLPAISTVANGGAHVPGAWAFAGGAVAAPLVEEWLFRGLLWNQLRRGLSERTGIAVAIAVGSLVFGLWHMTFEGYTWLTFQNAIVHAAFGALMAIARWRTGGLALGCALHASGNAFAIVTM